MPKANRVPSRYEAFLDGTLTAADLDDEELRRGQLRDKNGNFSGRPTNVVPREFHTAMAKELVDRAQGRINQVVGIAVEVLLEIATNKRAPAVARNQAALALMERSMGKVPDKVQQEVMMKTFESDLEDIVEADDNG